MLEFLLAVNNELS